MFDGLPIEIRLRTKDITLAKGENVRFINFDIDINPTGNRSMFFRYLLDGRLSNPTDSSPEFYQTLEGEVKSLGFVNFNNQAQVTKSIQPKINYALGQSIAFEIYDNTLNMDFSMSGIGIDFIYKESKKDRRVGQ